MKKLLALLLAVCMVLSLPAYGFAAEAEDEAPDALAQQQSGTASLDAATAAAAASGEEPQYGGTVIIGVPADPDAFMAAFSTDTYSKYYWQPMAVGLLDYDAANGMEPVCSELAESYDFSEDCKTLTFHLKDASWTDDTPITSADVKMSIEMAAKYNSNMTNALANLESIECPDDKTVVINLSAPNSALVGFFHSFYCSILPEHVWGDYVEAPETCPEYNDPTTVGGPFVLEEYVAGDHATYVKNEKYWSDTEPYLDSVILKIIPDQTTMGEALEAGEIDVTQCAAISYDECDRLRGVDGITVFDIGKELRSTVYYVSLNTQREYLSDPEVRIALLEAIDQEEIIEKCFSNYGQVSYSPVPNNSAFTSIRVEPDAVYSYNVEDAAARLDNAGYEAGADGSRGITLTAVIENNEKEMLIAESIRSYWAEVGVDLEIVALDRAAECEQVYVDYDYDLTMIDGGLSHDFSTCANRYVSTYTGNYTNPSRLNNPEIDELFGAVGTQEGEEQTATYAELQNLIAAEAANMWFQNWAPYAVNSNLGGFPARPDVQFDNWAGIWWKEQ